MHKSKDLAGQVFGRLTVVERSENKGTFSSWLCTCECGTSTVVLGVNLTGQRTASCGCLRKERVRAAKTTHGLRSHPLRATWQQMVYRCTNPSATSYEWYGARGVSVFKDWTLADGIGLRAFIEYVESALGEKPTDQHTLDRMDNDGNYEPGNIRWASKVEQTFNRRTNSGTC